MLVKCFIAGDEKRIAREIGALGLSSVPLICRLRFPDAPFRDDFGQSLWHYAAVYNLPKVCSVLAEKDPAGAFAERTDTKAQPLHFASALGHLGVVRALLDIAKAQGNEAMLATKNSAGNTALHLAASSGRTLTADLLIAAGADTNAVNEQGLTPLDLACKNSRTAVAAALIAAGARIDTKSEDGVEALMRIKLGVLPDVPLGEATDTDESGIVDDAIAMLDSGKHADFSLSETPVHKCILAAKFFFFFLSFCCFHFSDLSPFSFSSFLFMCVCVCVCNCI